MNTNAGPELNRPTMDLACPECRGRREGFQVYSTTRLKDRLRMAWDVDLALQICSDGREAVRLHPSCRDELLSVNQFDPVHLDHVDPALPGIICAVDYTEDSLPVLCLIDGSHRAARCRREEQPFFAYVLSDEESQRCQRTSKVRLFLALTDQQALTAQPTAAPAGFDPGCAECVHKRENVEVYTFQRFDGAIFGWDITLAREMCSNGRQAYPVPPEHLDIILSVNKTDSSHLDHVNPHIPGIACKCSDAEESPLQLLIDGSHRAARCRRDNLPFFVYFLSDEESKRCQRQVLRDLSDFLERV